MNRVARKPAGPAQALDLWLLRVTAHLIRAVSNSDPISASDHIRSGNRKPIPK